MAIKENFTQDNTHENKLHTHMSVLCGITHESYHIIDKVMLQC